MSTLFDPIRIGTVELRNRLAMAPIKTAFGSPQGEVTEPLVAFARRRAKGGVGLIVSEPLYVDQRGQEHPKQLGIDTDGKIPGLRRLTDAIHLAGAKVFAHLNHAGRAANPKVAGGPPEAPSRVTCARTGVEPVELAPERIGAIVEAFAQGARRAQTAGFDGVELQFGLGYLVSQFLSPRTNLRDDDYGGNPERRLRFAAEVFRAVRIAVGDDVPIGVRISGSEKVAGGLELDDAKALARHLEGWGADLIHVATGSNCESLPWYYQHMALPPSVNETLATAIREEVKLPVMAAGRLGDPPRIREVLGGDGIDMVALGRPLLADPDLPSKMLAGKDEDVLLCGHCLQACFARVKSGEGLGCNVNPELGRELEPVVPAEQSRHVVVVGGGPAGMQAALTAQRRGHRVTLLEQDDQLGGQFALAHLAPGKARMHKPLQSLIHQVDEAAIEVRLGQQATIEAIEALGPDAVVLATGSRPTTPTIAGLEHAIAAEDVLTTIEALGERVLLLGAGMVGLEVAEAAARSDKSCVVVELLDEAAHGMDPLSRTLLLKRLASLPVTIHTGTELLRLADGRAVVRQEGKEVELGPFDSVVVATGRRSHDPLSAPLRDHAVEVTLAGDVTHPAQLYDAVSSGHLAAMAL